ncbi:hypothetical protein [Ferrovum sp.]|uniref:hypothetical protein n=1 Tax=Ferrovum sp. TaxID=2609467 RepID=UPI00262C1709|nr:hypothetical protein [Ferrovum sp.]
MTDFLDFARACGLNIKNLVAGKIARCSTIDHPRKQNGAYLWEGEFGWVQNWACDSEPRIWKLDKPRTKQEEEEFSRRMKTAFERHEKERRENHQRAAEKAVWIIRHSKLETHAYLDKKGFPETEGLVWRPTEDQNLLVIPMKIGEKIVGCQMIDRDGGKKFLFGQQCKGAEYRIGSGKLHVYCEGYATGLSVVKALQALKRPFTLHVCFSASNMLLIAQRGLGGLVVADNDESVTGERVAKEIGIPYFLPPEGDFNDFWSDVGTFKASQALRKVLITI